MFIYEKESTFTPTNEKWTEVSTVPYNDSSANAVIYNNEILFERSSYYSKENTILMKDFTHNDFTLTICSVYEIVTFFTIGNHLLSIMYS